jgi:hypothetical protein
MTQLSYHINISPMLLSHTDIWIYESKKWFQKQTKKRVFFFKGKLSEKIIIKDWTLKWVVAETMYNVRQLWIANETVSKFGFFYGIAEKMKWTVVMLPNIFRWKRLKKYNNILFWYSDFFILFWFLESLCNIKQWIFESYVLFDRGGYFNVVLGY